MSKDFTNVSLSPLETLKTSIKSVLRSVGVEIKRSYSPGRDLTASSKAILSNQFKNYHLGCGRLLADDFLNIDGRLKIFTKKWGVPVLVEGTKNTYVLRHHLQYGIPAADSSLNIIYHSHFLEHLANKDGIVFLFECFRCLTEGGTMRFAVPDFDLWCKHYISGNTDFFDWYRESYLEKFEGDQRDQKHETNAMVFSGMLFNWGHRMAYDFQSLSVRLSEIGFTNIRRVEWGTGKKIPHLDVLESSDSDRKVESLVVECSKPIS